MEMRSAQETFDFVVLALRRQGKPATHPQYGCMYRTPEGQKCAVGQAIPDGLYDKRFEGLNISNIKALCKREGWEDPFDGHNETVLTDLQLAHDGSVMVTPPIDTCASGDAEWLQEFLHRARVLAENLGLSSVAIATSIDSQGEEAGNGA